MGKGYLSRHFLSTRATSLIALPFAPAGHADTAGVSTTHNVLAFAGWNEDAQEYQLGIGDLIVKYSGNDVVETPNFSTLASFRTGAEPLCLASAEINGRVFLIAAHSDGSLARLRIEVPSTPGSLPEMMQLCEEDFSDADVLPWVQAHRGPATAVDVNAGSKNVLSVSTDGTITVTPADAPADSEQSPIYNSGAATAFTSCKWTTPHTFATTSLQGLLHLWDLRAGATPVRSEASAGGAREPLLSLAVHPAQPFTCATGSAAGEVAIWDLRTAGKCTVHNVGGGVSGLEYDRSGGLDEQLAFCTTKGAIGALHNNGVQLLYEDPNAAVDAVCLKAAGAAAQLFASTEQEGLIFMANPL